MNKLILLVVKAHIVVSIYTFVKHVAKILIMSESKACIKKAADQIDKERRPDYSDTIRRTPTNY